MFDEQNRYYQTGYFDGAYNRVHSLNEIIERNMARRVRYARNDMIISLVMAALAGLMCGYAYYCGALDWL